MEGYLKQVEQFVVSGENIFMGTSLDYPTVWQQQLISSYFAFKQILQKPHTQVIRELNSQSEKQVQQVSQGCLYMLLLDPHNLRKLDHYILILRIDVWNMITHHFMLLLAEYGDALKPGVLLSVPAVLDRLMFYNLCQPYAIVLVSNFLATHDTAPPSQQLIKAILTLFIGKLEEGAEFTPEVIQTISNYMCPRVVKICPYVEQSTCLAFLGLWADKYPQFMDSAQEILYIIESSSVYMKIAPLAQIYIKAKQRGAKGMEKRQREQIIFAYLPRKLQTVLQFIFSENIKGNELAYQLGWTEKYWLARKYNYMEILIDLARWAVFNSDFIEQRLIILEWLCKRTFNSNLQIQEKTKKAIFSNWFVEEKEFDFENALAGLITLRHLLSIDARLSIEMLKFILKWASGFEKRLQQIFQKAIAFNHFKLEFIMGNRLIPESIQSDFFSITTPPKKQTISALQFDPADSPIRSDEGEAPNYNIDSQSKSLDNSPLKCDQILQILTEECYVEQFTKLYDMLDDPTYDNFVQFFKQFVEACQLARTSNKELLPVLMQQTAKVIYCTFNSEFEDLGVILPAQESIIYHMIAYLLKSWHQVTHRIILVKEVLKKLFEIFPTAQVAFWCYFFSYCEYGSLNTRDFKNWLVPKQKSDLVVRAVEAIAGKVDANLRRKVAKYLGK